MNGIFKIVEVSSPADDLLLGANRTMELTPPPNPHETNIRSLLTLGTNESDAVKMKNMSVKRFEGVELNGLSYPLVSSTNVRETLAEMLYIGDMKFVSVISKELLRRIQHYNLNFDIILSPTESCKITNINICPTNIVDNSSRNTGNLIVVVVKVGVCLALTTLEPCQLLSYKDYIYYERVGIRSQYIFDGVYYEDIPVQTITINHVVLNTPKNINKGSPLTVDGVVVGLYAYTTMDNAYYVRLSAVNDWLNHFTVGSSNNRSVDVASDGHSTIPAKVEYSPEQLYSIIYDLSDRVLLLENQLKDMMASRR